MDGLYNMFDEKISMIVKSKKVYVLQFIACIAFVKKSVCLCMINGANGTKHDDVGSVKNIIQSASGYGSINNLPIILG